MAMKAKGKTYRLLPMNLSGRKPTGLTFMWFEENRGSLGVSSKLEKGGARNYLKIRGEL